MGYLIKNDLYFLLKPPIWLVLLTNAFLWDILAHALNSIAFVGPILAFQFILLIGVFDGGYSNDVFINSLPVRRATIVHAKFVESLVFIGIGYILAFVIELPVFFIKGFHVFSFSYPLFVRGIGDGLILIAIFLFVRFKTRSSNAEVSFGYALIVSVLFEAIVLFLFRQANLGASGTLTIHLVFFAAIVIYLVLYFLSLRSYQQKDI